jgi:hypothetical protein
MNWLHTVSYFFGGLFLANVVPHFVSGIMGKPFQTPFAKPPGKGLSSSTVNVLWLREFRLRLSASGARRTLRSATHRPRRLQLAYSSSSSSRHGI